MMNTIISIFTCVFESVMYFSLLSTYTQLKEKFSRCSVFIGIAILSLLIYISNNFFSFGMWNAAGIIASIFIMSFMYECHIAIRLIISTFGVFLSATVEIITLFSMAYLSNVSSADIINIDELRILGTVLSKILSFAAFKFVCSKGKNKVQKTNTYWAMFFLTFLTSALSVFLFFNLSYNSPDKSLNNITAICSVGLLISNFFVLYLFEHMTKQSEIINKQKIFEQQLKSQSKHFDEILFTQKQLRKFKHDISNHLTALVGYFKKNSNDEGIEYIKKLEASLKESNNSISTGNIALDAIIETKQTVAESKGIVFSSQLQLYAGIKIDPIDLCVIFGNALDNAIEACEKIEDFEKHITLHIVYNKDSLICKVSNSCIPNEKQILSTTKNDIQNHGFGIDNIKAALSNYNHIFNIKQEKSEFMLSFVIFDV